MPASAILPPRLPTEEWVRALQSECPTRRTSRGRLQSGFRRLQSGFRTLCPSGLTLRGKCCRLQCGWGRFSRFQIHFETAQLVLRSPSRW